MVYNDFQNISLFYTSEIIKKNFIIDIDLSLICKCASTWMISKLLLNVEIMGKRKKNAIDSTTKPKVKNFETATRQVHLKSGDERVENSES